MIRRNPNHVFVTWDPNYLKKFADNVNNAKFAYDNWNTIVSNLLDARRFSVHYFRQAFDMGWCLMENERSRRNAVPPGDNLYNIDMYRALLHHVKHCGILQDFDNDPHVAAMPMKKLSRDVVKHCQNEQE